MVWLKRSTYLVFLMGSCLLAGTSTSLAGTLVSWNFGTAVVGSGSTATGNADLVSPTYVNSSLSSSCTLARGAGFTADNLQNLPYFGPAPGALNTYNSVSPTDLATAQADNFYVQFTATPNSPLSLTELDFVAYQQLPHASATIAVLYDTGSGYTLAGSASNISSGWIGSPYEVSLSGISALQDLSGPVSFRLYFYGFGAYEDRGLGQTGSMYMAPDINGIDLALQGSSVPEPSAMILAAIGAVGVIGYRRANRRTYSRP